MCHSRFKIIRAQTSVAEEVGPCNDAKDLQALLDPVNERCCDEPEDDCSSGVPSTCDADCGAVLLPFRAACADFLKIPMNAGMKNLIDQAANGCRVRPGVGARPPPPPGPCEPNPCKNGGWCRLPAASGAGPPGGGHRLLQKGADSDFTCTCAAGFSGADCSSGSPEEPWCHMVLPSLPDTLANWLDPTSLTTLFTVTGDLFDQASAIDWTYTYPSPYCDIPDRRPAAHAGQTVYLPRPFEIYSDTWDETNCGRINDWISLPDDVFDEFGNPRGVNQSNPENRAILQADRQSACAAVGCSWGYDYQDCSDYHGYSREECGAL